MKYHYVYLLINPTNDMMYIGKRSCDCLPNDDTKYMSSSKYVPKEECDKLILEEFSTATEAIEYEKKLHEQFDVGVNPSFYNKSKQTSTGFDTTGIVPKHVKTKEWSKICSNSNLNRDYTKLSSFKPWFIKDPEGNIQKFLEISKRDQAEKDGYSRRYYETLYQRTEGKRPISRGPLKGYTIGHL